MSNPSEAPPSCALPPHLAAWRSLVSRSITAWDDLDRDKQITNKDLPTTMLQRYHSLDNFLQDRGRLLMFWFFQHRNPFMSQNRIRKWSRDKLDNYILLPTSKGFVMRQHCFFVSHFWQTKDHPDPDGEYLRLHQVNLESQTWSYIWVDWTCMPQSPRAPPEQEYFRQCLRTMPGIIRNCGFTYFYPPFEARLWILFEITEYVLTCEGDIPITPDIKLYLQHIDEMRTIGVRATLAKYGYRCSDDGDRRHLTSWLELLILLSRLNFDIYMIRRLMDFMTWSKASTLVYYPGVKLDRFEGTLVVNEETYTFTPFPQ